MPTIKQYFTLKKITLFLTILLPIFFILFLAGGCSFKLIDPQYYRFLSLCENVDSEVVIHNRDYWEIIENRRKGNTQIDDRGEYFYNKRINKRIYFDFTQLKSINVSQRDIGGLTIATFEHFYDSIHYATEVVYSYSYKGIFLGGDEGRGFYWYYEKHKYCEDIK
ncbi:hypothetical protein [Helicobacter trogontum]|uniref:hypothetical protein n=1 Tax=Helicobacter trogontum TaxID=50960 RepID=UPI000AF1D109|nr:hypothetical protein [Helicobacter trogontum]MDY5184971.1 hypothetical protein [Helicobacter trogontum]